MPSFRNLPIPGIEPRSLALQADSLPSKPPGKPKNTGVGNLLLPQGIFLTQGSPALHAGSLLAGLSRKIKNTAVGSLSLLYGVFSTEASNRGSLHCKQILHQLSHQGSPRILQWVACPFSRGSSQPRDGTQVSRIASRFFTS